MASKFPKRDSMDICLMGIFVAALGGARLLHGMIDDDLTLSVAAS